ncbi:hypothetical protein [Saccharopolyspora phatthalungensis]|uniref:Uncharacterized protein n=1 Tax=Saccharopolyspora phatthalungensis TaxID=664693 RepID=A0A840QFM9_9PSEU|nr:hypothetical protein [Saccharopolyspora phatthalungensis]MBB5157285.1 hypothetical protein [Saccharopolyspora phatthalungensis]
MQSQSTAPASDRPQNGAHGYERPTIVATFAKSDLADELPEDLTPHVHATQNS